MDEAERLMFEGWAMLPQFKKKVEQAKQIIKDALEIAPTYVACSWGKDSLVLSHLALLVSPAIPIIHIGECHQDTLDNYTEVEFDFLHRFPCNYSRFDLGLKNAKLTFESISKELPPVAFIGLRKEESRFRKLSLLCKGVIYQYQSGNYRVCPLAFWDWKDIWGYIVLHNLKYLNSYDSQYNQPKNLSRTAVHIGRGRGSGFGRFERLRRMNPGYYEIIKSKIIGI